MITKTLFLVLLSFSAAAQIHSGFRTSGGLSQRDHGFGRPTRLRTPPVQIHRNPSPAHYREYPYYSTDPYIDQRTNRPIAPVYSERPVIAPRVRYIPVFRRDTGQLFRLRVK